MKRLSGIVIPLVTPLTEEDTVDVESLKRLTDYCIDGGMTALYPCGTTGEMMYLTVEERKLVAETVVKQAAGRIPVFVHVGAWNQSDTIELAQHADSPHPAPASPYRYDTCSQASHPSPPSP